MSGRSNRAVLVVGNFLAGTLGHRSVCEELVEQLASSGWSVTTTSSEPSRVRRLADMVGTSWRERHAYDVAQVDVYSGHAFAWAEAVCWTLRRARKPYVLILHGGNLPGFAERWPGRVRRLFEPASLVVAPSSYLRDRMRPYRKDVVCIPNGLDVASYRWRPRERAEPKLIWLRAFHEIYNPSLAPKVVRLLEVDFPGVRLAMVGRDKGDGSLGRTVRTAESLGVEHRLTLPGGIPKADVARWMNTGDVFLNTTNVDNTPVSVLEAMASGLCVVSTNVGGISHLLEDEHDALLVPPDDPRAMADAVRRILSDPALARRLSANARAKAKTFDWSVVLPRLESALLSASEAGWDRFHSKEMGGGASW
jgi:glycosyltransferase involved in cell wall biosynthesis